MAVNPANESLLEKLSSSVNHVSDQLFKEAKIETQINGLLSDATLKSLSFIHGPSFLSALDLVDRHAICHVTSSSGKSAYQVKSSVGPNYYTCHISLNTLCSCPSFSYGAVAREGGIFCKHLLAVKISEATGTAKQETMSDDGFDELFEENKNH